MKIDTETAPHPQRHIHQQRLLENHFYNPQAPSLKRRLEETVSLLEATLNATHDGIVVVDSDGKIVRYNQRFLELWQISAAMIQTGDDEMILQYVMNQLQEPKEFLEKVKFLYANPDAESFDELRFKDGRIYERYSRPQYVDGESRGRVWSFHDVTKQKRSEEKLHALLENEHQLRLESEKNLQLREDFLSIASHELRTPLTPLSLHLQILQRFLNRADVAKIPDCTKQLDLMTRALSQVNRITRLVEDLLDVSRITTGRLSLASEEFDLCCLIREVVDRYSSQLKSSHCVLDLDLPPQILGEWDRLRVEQVLTNLLTNAMKFGAGRPIEIKATAVRDEVFVRVRDHGIGVSDEDQQRIFDRFERAVSQRHYGGLGLGLYIVRQILEGHGGNIRVESRLGDGSTFVVSMPRFAKLG